MNRGYAASGAGSSANSTAYFGDTVSASSGIAATSQPVTQKKTPGDLESAVFSYIQAVRALGKTGVNTAEISRALGIPLSEVEGVIKKLVKKGVKVAA